MAESGTSAVAASPPRPPGPTDEGTHRGRRSHWASALSWRRLSAVYLGLTFIVIFSVLAPDTFLTRPTFQLVFSEGVITCFLALAFLIPLVCGVYDLSFGAVLGLSVALSVFVEQNTDLPPSAGAAIALGACALTGAMSGFLVVRLHVDSFIATLGVSQVLFAFVLLLTRNNQQTASFPRAWSRAATGTLLGVPLVLVYLLVLAGVLWFVLEHTRIGRHMFAIRGNREAARLAGVQTDRIIWGAFVVAAVVAGLAGIIYSMRIGVSAPSVGPGFLFPAVGAVFLGASQLSQRPNVWGTLIAYFALAFGIQGLVLSASGAATWSQPLFQGVSLIIAVAIAARPVAHKLRARRDDARRAGEGE